MQFVLPLRGATQLGPSHFLFGAGQHAGKLVDDTIKFMCSSWTLSLARLYSLYSLEPASSIEQWTRLIIYLLYDIIDDVFRVALNASQYFWLKGQAVRVRVRTCYRRLHLISRSAAKESTALSPHHR